MRVFFFLSLLSLATALFDAVIWEAESWYKVYLAERLVYPTEEDKWQMCPECELPHPQPV